MADGLSLPYLPTVLSACEFGVEIIRIFQMSPPPFRGDMAEPPMTPREIARYAVEEAADCRTDPGVLIPEVEKLIRLWAAAVNNNPPVMVLSTQPGSSTQKTN